MGTERIRITGHGNGPPAPGVPAAGAGAMTSGSWPRATRCSATLRVQCATPLTSGGKDSATIAIRTFTKSEP